MTLLPELIERIALFIASPLEIQDFVSAFPRLYLTECLCSLLDLFAAVEARQIVAVPPQRIALWPSLELPEHIADEALMSIIIKCMPLYPSIDIDDPDILPRYTRNQSLKLRLSSALGPHQLESITLKSRHRISCVHIQVPGDNSGHLWTPELLEQFCTIIPTLSSLERLSISWGRSSVKDCFPRVFNAITSSKATKIVLRFFSSGVVWTKSMVEAFTKWIHQQSVSNIVLHGLALEAEAESLLLEGLSKAPSLKVLFLTKCTFVQTFFRGNRQLPTQLLSFKASSCSSTDLPHIATTIQNTSIQRLILEFTKDPGATEEADQLVLQTLPTLSHLRWLELPYFTLTSACYESLASLLPRLVKLDLKSNNLRDDGIVALASALPLCTRLQILHLFNQDCTDVGAVALAEGIIQCKSLKKIDLGDNAIENEGAIALSKALPALSDVDLSYNGIAHEGAIALGNVMPDTSRMAWLNLEGNPLGIDGVQAIINGCATSSYRRGSVELSCTLENMDDITKCQELIDQLPDPAWCLIRHELPDLM
ncbi:hypothetical protein THRCLA_04609 [Thraustotheca clavata]|uniref:RNI-like protein n=1 Tax=Thraustotheca clavata TaxID=74557 RepID=A0A1V9ZYJ3_9STRA|nr:hypothetical protein THRCLA_04609 [Thraustotheca clavata]